jgi:hypothetical protein
MITFMKTSLRETVENPKNPGIEHPGRPERALRLVPAGEPLLQEERPARTECGAGAHLRTTGKKAFSAFLAFLIAVSCRTGVPFRNARFPRKGAKK